MQAKSEKRFNYFIALYPPTTEGAVLSKNIGGLTPLGVAGGAFFQYAIHFQTFYIYAWVKKNRHHF